MNYDNFDMPTSFLVFFVMVAVIVTVLLLFLLLLLMFFIFTLAFLLPTATFVVVGNYNFKEERNGQVELMTNDILS